MSSLIQLSVHRDRWGDYNVYLHPRNSSKVPSEAVIKDEFASMVKAVEEAISWATHLRQKNNLPVDTDEVAIEVCYSIIVSPGGLYPGGIIGHDPYDLSDQSLAELRQWAAEWDERLPKCDHCGEIVGCESYINPESEWTGFKFCSESCADHDYWEQRMHEEDEEDDEDDQPRRHADSFHSRIIEGVGLWSL